jgi:hypothetical protein
VKSVRNIMVRDGRGPCNRIAGECCHISLRKKWSLAVVCLCGGEPVGRLSKSTPSGVWPSSTRCGLVWLYVLPHLISGQFIEQCKPSVLQKVLSSSVPHFSRDIRLHLLVTLLRGPRRRRWAIRASLPASHWIDCVVREFALPDRSGFEVLVDLLPIPI